MTLSKSITARLGGDKLIWLIIILLTAVSLIAVYSSTGTIAYKDRGGNTEYYLFKHGVIVFLGLLITIVLYRVHYLKFSKIAPFLWLLSIPLLIFTVFFGAEVNDARRWITLPIINLTFQTSDFGKLALIIYLARTISAKQEYISDFKSAFVPIIVPIILTCGLIAPADLSSALLLFLTCFIMMFIGRVHYKFLLLLLAGGMVAFAFLILLSAFFPDFIRQETWISRIQEFVMNSDGGYQIQQSKIAIAKGGFFGLGPGNSIQRNFLPSPYSDFIYSIICEEFGLIGAFLIVAIYLGLFLRTVSLVTKSPKAFGAMLAMGLSVSLVLQALTNMAVSVHLVPVTGLTLPMVSMGGTSLIFTSMSFGIILSVSRYIEKLN